MASALLDDGLLKAAAAMAKELSTAAQLRIENIILLTKNIIVAILLFEKKIFRFEKSNSLKKYAKKELASRIFVTCE